MNLYLLTVIDILIFKLDNLEFPPRMKRALNDVDEASKKRMKQETIVHLTTEVEGKISSVLFVSVFLLVVSLYPIYL